MRRFCAVWAVCVLVGCASKPSPEVVIQQPATGPWSSACVSQWHAHRLPGKRTTHYASGTEGSRSVVQARADRSASLLRQRLRIEPTALGRLQFSWRVPALIASADVRERDAEDSPARIVLAFDGDHARLSDRDRLLFDLAESLGSERPPFATLMYVWDNEIPIETVVPGNRTTRMRKIVIDSGPADLDQWRLHDRDIAADYQRAYGEPPGALIAVGMMTDADNTGTRTVAAYGPVCFPGTDLRAVVR